MLSFYYYVRISSNRYTLQLDKLLAISHGATVTAGFQLSAIYCSVTTAHCSFAAYHVVFMLSGKRRQVDYARMCQVRS